MKKSEVPQDPGALTQKNMKEILYAVDETGHYTQALSTGWETKTIALDESMDVIEERVAEARENFRKNLSSPIPYYMELNRMDLSVLSAYAGMPAWRVKRHFRPAVFKKLGEKILQKYADAFSVPLSELKEPKI